MSTRRVRFSIGIILSIVVGLLAPASAIAQGPKADVVEFTLVALVPGQPLGPTLFLFHDKKKDDLFKVGKPASDELFGFASFGFLQGLEGLISDPKNWTGIPASGGLDDETGLAIVAGGIEGAAQNPSYRQAQFGLEKKAQRLTTVVIGMACLNDGFAAVQDVQRPKKGKSIVVPVFAYDAGTERNTESFSDLPSECSSWLGLTYPEGERPGQPREMTAANEDAEGMVALHPGVMGIADLDAEINGFDGPVGLLIIKNLGRQKGGAQ